MERSSSPARPAGAAAGRPGAGMPWGLLIVLAGNMLIDAVEVSVMVVAHPAIAADLGLPLAWAQWTLTGFAIGFGGLMLFGGRVVALLGRRRVYLAGLLGFAAASLLAAVTGDPALLIATRVVKGFCAALTAPTGLAIIATAFPEGRPRSTALSVYTLFGASGFTAGLLLSGWLTQVGWRLTAAFPAPVVLMLFLFALRLLPAAEPGGPAPRRFGLTGAVTGASGLLALVAGIVAVPEHGWSGLRSAGALALAALLLGAFALAERRAAEPLARWRLLADGALLRSALGAAALNGSYLGLLFTLSYQLQTVAGRSPLYTAVAFLPAAAPLALTAPLAGRLVAAVGARRLIALGAVFPPLGYLLALDPTWPTRYASGLLPTLVLVGLGFVLSFAALNAQATSGLPPSDRGAATGLYQTAVQAGAALTVALVAALLTAAQPGPGASPDALLAACGPALTLVTATGALGLLVALTGLKPRRDGAHPSGSPSIPAGREPESGD